MKTVPQDVLLKYVSLYISKDATVLTLKNLLSLFDARLVFESLFLLINHDESPELNMSFAQTFQEYFLASIIENPVFSSYMLDKLSLIQVENVVVERFNEQDRKEFLEKIYIKLGHSEYASPLPVCADVKLDVKPEESHLNEALKRAIEDRLVPNGSTFDLLKNFLTINVQNPTVYHSVVEMFSSVFHTCKPHE